MYHLLKCSQVTKHPCVRWTTYLYQICWRSLLRSDKIKQLIQHWIKLLYGLAFKDILSWPAIFWNQLHAIIDKNYYSLSMKKYSLASVYLIIEAKREIRNQISFDEGGQRTLSLQFVGSQYKCRVSWSFARSPIIQCIPLRMFQL